MDIGPPPPLDIFEFVGYDPITGVFTRLKCRIHRLVGGRADIAATNGYRRIMFRAKEYSGQRLAWYFMTGEWPDCLIFHRNAIVDDNRFANLRKATASQNQANRVIEGAIPLKGVTFHKATGRYQAQIRKDNHTNYLGLFSTKEEAHEAYAAAALTLHGEFARLT